MGGSKKQGEGLEEQGGRSNQKSRARGLKERGALKKRWGVKKKGGPSNFLSSQFDPMGTSMHIRPA